MTRNRCTPGCSEEGSTDRTAERPPAQVTLHQEHFPSDRWRSTAWGLHPPPASVCHSKTTDPHLRHGHRQLIPANGIIRRAKMPKLQLGQQDVSGLLSSSFGPSPICSSSFWGGTKWSAGGLRVEPVSTVGPTSCPAGETAVHPLWRR